MLIIFAQIAAVPIFFVTSQYCLYTTVLSRDPWFHWTLTDAIFRSGKIPVYDDFPIPYVAMPGFHLIVSAVEQVTSLDYKWASFLGIGITSFFILLLTSYMVGKLLFKNLRIALLSCLFVSISDNVLDMIGKNIVPNSIGVALTFLILFFIMKNDFYCNIKLKALIILMMLALVLTHSVSYAFLLFQLIIAIIVANLFSRQKHFMKGVDLLVIGFFLALLVWGFYSIFYIHSLSWILETLVFEGVRKDYAFALPVSIFEVFLSRLGMVIFLIIAGFSSLTTLISSLIGRKKSSKKLYFSIMTSSFVAGSGSFLLSALYEIAHRFWYYAEVLGSVLLAKLFFKSGIKSRIAATTFVFFISYFMFTASISNDDNPLVPQYSIRTGWRDSEVAAGMFLVHYSEFAPMGSDLDFYMALRFFSTNILKLDSFKEIPLNYISNLQDITDNEGIYVMRLDLLKNRFFVLGSRWDQHSYIPLGEKVLKITHSLVNISSNVYYNKYSLIIYN